MTQKPRCPGPGGTFVLLVFLPLGSGLWGCCECPSDPEKPVIEALESDVEEVQIAPWQGPAPARTFQLHLWYRLSNGDRVSDYFGPMDRGFAPTGEGDFPARGMARVTKFISGSAATVTASKHDDAGMTAEVTLPRWDPAGDATARNGGSDVVKALHETGAVPTIAVVERDGGGTCGNSLAQNWERYAFVGAAAVGEHNPPCSVAILSGTHQLLFQSPPADAAWGTPGGVIDFAAAMNGPLDLKIKVYIAVTARTASVLSGIELTDTDELVADVGDAAEAIARVDVDWANIIYEANRVGIRVAVEGAPVRLTVTDALPADIGADPQKCEVAQDLAGAPAPRNTWIAPTMISVYYVDRIHDSADPEDVDARGLHCKSQATTGPVLFISYTRHTPTALAHEIGHALSLKHPEDMAADLDLDKMLRSTNLMSSAAMDGPLAADVRSRLTLGQVFRMNVSDDSWLNDNRGPRTGAAQRLCRIGGRCPPQDFDAR
jgi:hypothetical protein